MLASFGPALEQIRVDRSLDVWKLHPETADTPNPMNIPGNIRIRCYPSVTPVLPRCYPGVTLVLPRCYPGVTGEEDFLAPLLPNMIDD